MVNRTRSSAWADYAAIASRHLFTLFNFIVVPAAVALFYHNEWQAGISVSGTALVNTLIGLFQEWRAKRQLDQLAILNESKVRVIRDGHVGEIPATTSSSMIASCSAHGDTVIADGVVLEAHYLELDEALLTGESDPVRRQVGDRVLSGSICVTGEGCYRAEKVGDQAFAQTRLRRRPPLQLHHQPDDASAQRHHHHPERHGTRPLRPVLRAVLLRVRQHGSVRADDRGHDHVDDSRRDWS